MVWLERPFGGTVGLAAQRRVNLASSLASLSLRFYAHRGIVSSLRFCAGGVT
jgi:hypothetical protein